MFVKNSFLPDSSVSHVIIDKAAPGECVQNLKKLKITPLPSARVAALKGAVATHPDMQLFHLGGGSVVCEPTLHRYYAKILSPLGFNVIRGGRLLCGNYPHDIAYNIARAGSAALHKKGHTEPQIFNKLIEDNVSIINVAQGYTKCAVCIVSKKAIITADKSIVKALAHTDIDVLKISEGNVLLKGLSYGFIGGASGLIAPGLLAFCGSVELHPDYRQIKDFAARHGVKIISLCRGELIDIGSIIPIKQEVIDWNNFQ